VVSSSRAALAVSVVAYLAFLGRAFLDWRCPSPCQTAWPLMKASNWIGLVVGLVAAGVLTVQLRGATRMS